MSLLLVYPLLLFSHPFLFFFFSFRSLFLFIFNNSKFLLLLNLINLLIHHIFNLYLFHFSQFPSIPHIPCPILLLILTNLRPKQFLIIFEYSLLPTILLSSCCFLRNYPSYLISPSPIYKSNSIKNINNLIYSSS